MVQSLPISLFNLHFFPRRRRSERAGGHGHAIYKRRKHDLIKRGNHNGDDRSKFGNGAAIPKEKSSNALAKLGSPPTLPELQNQLLGNWFFLRPDTRPAKSHPEIPEHFEKHAAGCGARKEKVLRATWCGQGFHDARHCSRSFSQGMSTRLDYLDFLGDQLSGFRLQTFPLRAFRVLRGCVIFPDFLLSLFRPPFGGQPGRLSLPFFDLCGRARRSPAVPLFSGMGTSWARNHGRRGTDSPCQISRNGFFLRS